MKRGLILSYILLTFLVICSALVVWQRNDRKIEMRVDLLEKAINVGKNPTFSWKVIGHNVGKLQKAFKIEISQGSSPSKEILDTGWIESSQSSGVSLNEIGDSLLLNNELYYWQVSIRDEKGTIIESPQSPFVTEIGEEWVSQRFIWPSLNNSRNFLRCDVELEKLIDIDKVILSVASVSNEVTRQFISNVYFNGGFIGAGPSREGDDCTYYNTYDVTDLVKNRNVIAINNYAEGNNKGILCQLTAFYKDGSKSCLLNTGELIEQCFFLDADLIYRTVDSDIGTGYFKAKAENINSTLWPHGWEEQGYKADDRWQNAACAFSADSRGILLKPYKAEAVLRYEVVPEKITELGQGHYLIDLGREIIGGIQLNVTSQEEKIITIRCGEELDSETNVKYMMRTGNTYEQKWMLKKGEQKLSNTGLMGIRYIEILDFPEKLEKNMVCGIAYRQAYEQNISSFKSSDDFLNELYEVMKYSIIATNQNILVDSQTRERAPYEGDAYINSLGSYAISDNYSLPRISQEWLLTHRTWPFEYVLYSSIMMWDDYMFTGDDRFIKEYYDILISNDYGRTLFLEWFDEDKKLFHVSDDTTTNFNSVLIDWPTAEKGNYSEAVYYNTVANAVAYKAFGALANIASVYGDSNSNWKDIQQQLYEGIQTHLYSSPKGAFSDGLDKDGKMIEHFSQHASAYMLYSGVCKQSEQAERVGDFVGSFQGFNTSIYGAFFVLNGLYESGHGGCAYDFMITDGVKSYKNIITNLKATIATEAWDPVIKENMSFSHGWGTAPISQLAFGLFGIKPIEPGFEKFQIKIQLGPQSASIKMPCVKGEIKVSYIKTRDNIEYKVSVPFNSVCKFVLPSNNITGIIVDGNECDIKNSLILNSGEHKIIVKSSLD